jgi:predicted phosphodiesterase
MPPGLEEHDRGEILGKCGITRSAEAKPQHGRRVAFEQVAERLAVAQLCAPEELGIGWLDGRHGFHVLIWSLGGELCHEARSSRLVANANPCFSVRLMGIAALYDIHGNLPALEAVLAELDGAGVDRVVVGGDVTAGPFPAECVDLLRELGPRVEFLRGNADREVVEGGEGDAGWCLARLGPERAAVVTAWPPTVRADVDGLGRLLFCHATPDSDEAIITPVTPDDAVAEVLAGAEADVVVYGHIHVQYERGRAPRLVNPGSVGWPYQGRRGAYWAILGPGVEFRRTEYDVEAAAEQIRASGYPNAGDAVARMLDPPTPEEATEQFEKLRGA